MVVSPTFLKKAQVTMRVTRRRVDRKGASLKRVETTLTFGSESVIVDRRTLTEETTEERVLVPPLQQSLRHRGTALSVAP